MPMWCRNILFLSGDEKEIKQMFKNIKSEESLIDFNKILPIPDNQKENWYKWCFKNWSTKWNASRCHKIKYNIVTYDTAYGPPEKVLKELSKQYPTLNFIVSFSLKKINTKLYILIH